MIVLELGHSVSRHHPVHYAKSRPIHVADRVYLEALVERSTEMGHIPSFNTLGNYGAL
jgi:hypothetical protein